jgi:SIR2-like domain
MQEKEEGSRMRALERDELRRLLAEELFESDDVDGALEWFIACHKRSPVIVVGAGFSRNAVFKKTGIPVGTAIPDWNAVTAALRDDLGLNAEDILDDLLVPEFYKKAPGLEFSRRLLELLPNDEIAPGPAHFALFDYLRPAAVITTNQLDTLLDTALEGDETARLWCRIIEDDELAAPEAERQVQLLYVHGHRSKPEGWIFGRGDYEDVERKRPVMMRRIRQLLSQHPVLYLGFSLTDPNFHAIVRQNGREMGLKQPRALACMLKRPRPEFVAYWQELGVTIATLQNAASQETVATRFRELFRVLAAVTKQDPNAALLTERAALESIRKKATFADKLAYAKEVLSTDASGTAARNLFRKELGEYGAWAKSHDTVLEALWKEVPIPSDEPARSEVVRGPKYVRPGDVPESHLRALSPEDQRAVAEEWSKPFVGLLGEARFKARDFVARAVDYNRRERVATWYELALWLSLWFDAFVDVGAERDRSTLDVGDFCNVYSYVWTECALSDPVRLPEARESVSRSLRLIRRYELRQATHVLDDLKRLGLSEPLSVPQNEIAEQMERASRALALSDYEFALDGYRLALSRARASRTIWYEWLALQGLCEVVGAMRSYPNSESYERVLPPGPDVLAWVERRAELENMPRIRAWIESSQTRRHKFVLEKIRQDNRASHDRGRLRRSWSSSSAGWLLWKAFRDLEESGAPYSTRSEMIAELLAARLGDDVEELRLRLKYRVDATDEWLGRLADEFEPSGQERASRDRSLVDEVLRGVEFASSKDLCGLMTQCVEMIQDDQLTQVISYLESMRDASDDNSRARDILSASCSVARLVRTESDLERVASLLARCIEGLHFFELYCLFSLPWKRWSERLSPGTTVSLVNSIYERVLQARGPASAAAIVGQVAATIGAGETMPRGIRSYLPALLAALEQGTDDEVVLKCIFTGLVALGVSTAEVLTRVEEVYGASWVDMVQGSPNFDQLSLHAWATTHILSRDPENSQFGEAFDLFLENLIRHRDEVLKQARPGGDADDLFRAAAWVLRRVPLTVAARREDLIALVEQAAILDPGIVAALGASLDEEHWGAEWPRLKALLDDFAEPTGAKNSWERQRAILSALSLRLAVCERGEGLPEELDGLVAAALRSVTSESIAVASAAAVFSASLLQHTIGRPPTRRLQHVVRRTVVRVASDPRPRVRASAAYGQALIASTSDAWAAEAFGVLCEMIPNESSALVLAERQFGKCEEG